MEKVKLTPEQASAFEKAINSLGVQSLVYEAVVNEKGFCGELIVLNELEPQDIVNAVKYGYEIDEHFIHEILEQNKRYREALEEIYELAEYDEYDNTLEQIVLEVEKALEG